MTDVSVSSRTASESPLTERQWVRRGELLEAARRVFERDGYHGTTVSAVVQAAGLSQGAFYLYFSDKKGVFAALQDEMATLLRRRIYWATRDVKDARQRLEAGLRAYFEFYEEYPAWNRRLTIEG
ncbi:MAG TPA: helix-turn-helix domain-containing protein, partial [Streptosporangiaceae bacterium]|nr:helix-turn-helix domain-containing protein [Streptosporangiaceae bacterium]